MKKNEVSKIFKGATNPSRRKFLISSGIFSAAMASSPVKVLATEKKLAKDKFVGIQIGAASFMDEGVDTVLDIVQKKGNVNAILLATFCYDRGLNGRQIPGFAFPDHGIRESDESFYHGGFYCTPHPEFYNNTPIKGDKMIAPDYKGVDVVSKVLPAARKKGIKVYCSVLDTFAYPEDQLETQLKNFVEIDLQGEKKKTLCFFRPEVKEFWKAVVTDIASSYDIDGIMFFNERNGPLINAIGATHAETFSSTHISCFCDDHKREAEKIGLNFSRVKEGYHKLDAFVQSSLRNERPSDGYYVEFSRLLLAYPEVIAYQQLFDTGKHQILKDVRDAVKRVKPKMDVGFHIEHVNSWNPFYRAGRNYEELASMADLLKVVAYNNCAGERFVHYINNIHSSVFRDVPPEELLRFHNHVLNYENEASLANLPAAGLSSEYVYRETARAIAGVKGKTRIMTGLDICIPTDEGSRKASPDDSYAATKAALRANPDGIILSRKYSEMNLTNLEAAGRAVRDSV